MLWMKISPKSVGRARWFGSPSSRVHSRQWKSRSKMEVWPLVVALWSSRMFHQHETAKTRRVWTYLGVKEPAGSELVSLQACLAIEVGRL